MAKKGIEEFLRDSLWKTPSVADQPMILLVRWRVLEARNAEFELERHLVGYNVDQHEGRVSTAIEHFDPTASMVVTRSGRVYHLMGPPGYDTDAVWVWEQWSRLNRMTDEIRCYCGGMEVDSGCGTRTKSRCE